MYATADTNNVSVTETQGRQLIASWLEMTGLPDSPWPLDRDDAAAVLQSAGYAVDSDEIRRLAWLGQGPNVSMYDAKDLLSLAGALEARRQWAAKSVHDGKKHHQLILLEEMLERGEAGVELLRESFRNIDLRFALLLLVEADNRELREKMLTTVFALLAIQGIRP